MTAFFGVRRSIAPVSRSLIGTLKQSGRSTVLTVVGRLDAETAALLGSTVAGHLDRGCRYLRIDLNRVNELTDDAITALQALHGKLLARRGTLVLTGVAGVVADRLSARAPGLLWLAPTAADELPESISV